MEVQEWLGADNQLGLDIWQNKYRDDSETFDAWLDRVSGGDEQVRELIKEQKFLFGGRILANRGLENKGKKITLSNCYVVEPPEDSIEELCQKLYAADRDAMAQTVELIRPDSVRKAADLLFSAEKVLCMGQGGSMILAQECAHLFSTARPNFYAVLDSHMQAIAASHLTARDVVLYFSYSGSTGALLNNLKIIRDRRAVAILVTRFPKSPGAAYADVVLQCGSLEGPLQGGSVAARVAQLYLMDVLFHEVCRRDVQGSAETREAVAEVLSDKHI